ncbi:hypothetical protein MBLNU230_g3703t1 [Neophaeotheca triangularis]
MSSITFKTLAEMGFKSMGEAATHVTAEENLKAKGPCVSWVNFVRVGPHVDDINASMGGMPLSLINKLGPSPPVWQPLPLSARLGVPMEYLTASQCNDHPFFRKPGELNQSLETLTSDLDPASSNFGEPGICVEGGVLIKLTDELALPLQVVHLDAFDQFVRERKAAIGYALLTRGLEAAKKEYAKVNPTHFKLLFKRIRAKDIAQHPQHDPYEGLVIPCPVKIDHDACEGCGKDTAVAWEEKAAGEAPLLKCAKCLKVMYCSRQCQKGDWKAHKPFCVASGV